MHRYINPYTDFGFKKLFGEEASKAFFDIHCTSQAGERFIIEMQKVKARYFKDRALFYMTFPIRDQYKVNKRDFCLNAIYFVGVLVVY